MTVLGGIDRRLLQNVDWPLLGAMGGLVILSATTLASLHIGRAGGNVAFRQLAWFTLGLFALVAVASVDYRRLVQRIERPDRGVVWSDAGTVNGHVDLNPAVWAFLRRSLWAVVNTSSSRTSAPRCFSSPC